MRGVFTSFVIVLATFHLGLPVSPPEISPTHGAFDPGARPGRVPPRPTSRHRRDGTEGLLGADAAARPDPVRQTPHASHCNTQRSTVPNFDSGKVVDVARHPLIRHLYFPCNHRPDLLAQLWILERLHRGCSKPVSINNIE